MSWALNEQDQKSQRGTGKAFQVVSQQLREKKKKKKSWYEWQAEMEVVRGQEGKRKLTQKQGEEKKGGLNNHTFCRGDGHLRYYIEQEVSGVWVCLGVSGGELL